MKVKNVYRSIISQDIIFIASFSVVLQTAVFIYERNDMIKVYFNMLFGCFQHLHDITLRITLEYNVDMHLVMFLFGIVDLVGS